MMSAQITLGQNVRLNRTLLLVGSQPGEDVNDQLPFVFWGNNYRRLKREAHTLSAIRALLTRISHKNFVKTVDLVHFM